MSTLAHYGFDSYPYLHVARRRCLPYARVLKAVMHLECGLALPDDLDKQSADEIIGVWAGEFRRRAMT